MRWRRWATRRCCVDRRGDSWRPKNARLTTSCTTLWHMCSGSSASRPSTAHTGQVSDTIDQKQLNISVRSEQPICTVRPACVDGPIYASEMCVLFGILRRPYVLYGHVQVGPRLPAHVAALLAPTQATQAQGHNLRAGEACILIHRTGSIMPWSKNLFVIHALSPPE